MNRRNLGYFEITTKLIENNPDTVAEILAKLKVVILKADWRPDLKSIEYLGLSDQFEEIKVLVRAFKYELIVSRSPKTHKVLKVTARKLS